MLPRGDKLRADVMIASGLPMGRKAMVSGLAEEPKQQTQGLNRKTMFNEKPEWRWRGEGGISPERVQKMDPVEYLLAD